MNRLSSFKSMIFIIAFISITFQSPQSYAQDSGWFWQYPKPQGNDVKKIWALNDESAAFIGRGGMFVKTSDAGKSWKARHLFEDGIDLFFLKNKLTGWVISNHTVYRTDDGGDNWISLFTADSVEFHSTFFVNENIGWIVGAGGEILKTSNGGRNWTIKRVNIYGDIPRLNEITFTDDSTGWIGGFSFYGNAIFKTTNQGTSWSRITNFSTVIYGVETISFAGKNYGWMNTTKGLIRTTNGGGNWQILSPFPWEIKKIYFTDKDTGWALGKKLSKTTDGGLSWTTINLSYIGNLYSIDFSNSTSWIGGSGGLIMKSTDDGNTWQRLDEKKRQFKAVHFCDADNGWAVGDSGVIMQTSDGGNNWTLKYESGRATLNSVFALSENKAICVGNEVKNTLQGEKSFGIIMKTSDGGLTWSKSLSDSMGIYYSVKFINNSGWIAGLTGYVVKTTNGGESWFNIKTNLPANYYFEKIDFVDENTGWMTAHNSISVYKTIDGGKNWVEQVVDSGFSMSSIDFVDLDYGWAAGEYRANKSFFRTTDGGNSWQAKKIPDVQNLTSVYFINRNVGWVIGYNSFDGLITSYIAKTKDGGESWSVKKLPVKNSEECIFMVNETVGYIAGDGILKTENGGLTSLTLSGKKNIPGSFALYQNYPNPFNPTTNISYSIPESEYVKITVHDLLGKEVATLVNESVSAGKHTVQFNAGNLPSGIYIYTINAGQFRNSKKLVLLQ